MCVQAKKCTLHLDKCSVFRIQVTIRGQLFPHEGGMGKSRFLIPVDGEGEEGANATGIGSVEELCLAHYRQQGFDQGKRFGFTFLWRTSSSLRATSNVVCRRARHPRRGLHLLHAVRPPAVGHRFHGGHPRRFQKSIPGTTSTLMYGIHNIPFIYAATWHPFPLYLHSRVLWIFTPTTSTWTEGRRLRRGCKCWAKLLWRRCTTWWKTSGAPRRLKCVHWSAGSGSLPCNRQRYWPSVRWTARPLSFAGNE